MIKKTEILAHSSDPKRPFSNLEPLVEEMVKTGNSMINPDGFVLEKDGWVCRLRLSINFELLTKNFNIPPSIKLSPDHDSVLDQNSWIEIVGGEAK